MVVRMSLNVNQEQCGVQNTALRYSFTKANIFAEVAIKLHPCSPCKEGALDPHVHLVTHTVLVVVLRSFMRSPSFQAFSNAFERSKNTARTFFFSPGMHLRCSRPSRQVGPLCFKRSCILFELEITHCCPPGG